MNKILHTRRSIDTQVGFEGSTVRLGQKWLELAGLEEIVDICICSPSGKQHEVIGTARILDRWVGIFRDIPARYVEMEQIVEDRSYSSLLSSLKSAYRNELTEDSEVTVLVYYRIS